MKIDLKVFCAKENESRVFLRKPLLNNGFILATNGHIAVRVPQAEVADSLTEAPANVTDILSKIAAASFLDGRPLKDFDLPGAEACPICSGAGQVPEPIYENCIRCEGSGEVECDMGHDHDCPLCDGEGHDESAEKSNEMVLCDACEGCGQKIHRAIQVGHSFFDLRYLLLIRDLDGCKICINEKPNDAAKFIFDGGEGFLMAMRGSSQPEKVIA